MLDIFSNIKKYDPNYIENKISKLNENLKKLNKEKEEFETKKSEDMFQIIDNFIQINEGIITDQLDRLNSLHHEIEQTNIKINKFKLIEQNLQLLLESDKVKELNNQLSYLNNN